MIKTQTFIQWTFVLWCAFCAFRMTQHERDIYKQLYEINKIKDGYLEVYCKD